MDESIFAGSRKHLWYEKSRRQEPLVYYSVWACNYTIEQDSKYIIFLKNLAKILNAIEMECQFLIVIKKINFDPTLL